MSNRERIARAAEEARLTAAEKKAKKTSKATKKRSTAAGSVRPKRAAKAPARVKIVWEVCTGTGTVAKTFPYPEKAAAEAELARLTKSGRTHILRATKVPME